MAQYDMSTVPDAKLTVPPPAQRLRSAQGLLYQSSGKTYTGHLGVVQDVTADGKHAIVRLAAGSEFTVRIPGHLKTVAPGREVTVTTPAGGNSRTITAVHTQVPAQTYTGTTPTRRAVPTTTPATVGQAPSGSVSRSTSYTTPLWLDVPGDAGSVSLAAINDNRRALRRAQTAIDNTDYNVRNIRAWISDAAELLNALVDQVNALTGQGNDNRALATGVRDLAGTLTLDLAEQGLTRR